MQTFVYISSSDDHGAGLFCEKPASDNLSFREGPSPSGLGSYPGMIVADVQAGLNSEGLCFMAKEIPLTRGKVTIVDDADFESLNAHKWQAWFHHNNWYARRTILDCETLERKTLSMHRVILNAPKGVEVDHQNHNGLDNQRHNIRLATGAQNQFNAKIRKDNTSGFKGVAVYSTNGKRTGQWKATIKHKGRDVHLGIFANPEDAARVYDRKALELRGEFAEINFPKEVVYGQH